MYFKRVAERGLWSELLSEAHDLHEEGKYPCVGNEIERERKWEGGGFAQLAQGSPNSTLAPLHLVFGDICMGVPAHVHRYGKGITYFWTKF